MSAISAHFGLYERIREAGYPVGGASYIENGKILYRVGALIPTTGRLVTVTETDERRAILAVADRLGLRIQD